MTRNNAVKYSDYAIGTFFDKAKKSSYWDDTIFIVIADMMLVYSVRTWSQ